MELIPREHFHRASYRYFEGMLYVLQCLHIYWYILFYVMGAQFLKTGKTVDTIQNPGKGQDRVLPSDKPDREPAALVRSEPTVPLIDDPTANDSTASKPHSA